MWVISLLVCIATALALDVGYDENEAKRGVWLSAAAYCNHDNYLTHQFQGPTAGFVVTYVIYDFEKDTEGFIGILPMLGKIYVVYRGTHSRKDWRVDLDSRKIVYSSYPECKCDVHEGMYKAEQRVWPGILLELQRLQQKYPTYSVIVTGHSLGAGMATFTSLDMIKAGIPNTVYNYGSPRLGDKEFSDFATSKVSTWRHTHTNDPVPHLPYMWMKYHHICTEMFEDNSGKVRSCDNSCEDPTCANQYSVMQTEEDSHMYYLGLYVQCESVSNSTSITNGKNSDSSADKGRKSLRMTV